MPLDNTDYTDLGPALPPQAIGGAAPAANVPPPPPPPNPTPGDTSALPVSALKLDGSSSMPDDQGPVMQPGQWAQPPEIAKQPAALPPPATADTSDTTAAAPPTPTPQQMAAPGGVIDDTGAAPTNNQPPVPKGAAGGKVGALGEPQYQDHEPRLQMPVGRYKQLEQDQPTLFMAINHVASDVGIPPLDLAALVYANSANDPNARKGNRVGYMGITPDDVKRYDPNGNLDPTNPVENLYLGAEKYRQITMQFGRGTPQAFAAYYTSPEITAGIQNRHPADHQQAAPHGTFDFINRVIGHDKGSAEAAAAGAVPQKGTLDTADTQASGAPSVPPDYAADTGGMGAPPLTDQERLARGLPLSHDMGAPAYNAPEPPPARTGMDRPLGQVLLDPNTWARLNQPNYGPYQNVQPQTTGATTYQPPPTAVGGKLQPAPPPPPGPAPPPPLPTGPPPSTATAPSTLGPGDIGRGGAPPGPPPPAATGTMVVGPAGQIVPPPSPPLPGQPTPEQVQQFQQAIGVPIGPDERAAGGPLQPAAAPAPAPVPAPASAATPPPKPGVTATPEMATPGGGATAPPSTAPPAIPPTAPTHAIQQPNTAPVANRVAFGDSYASAAIGQAHYGGTVAPTGDRNAAGTARDGAPTDEVLRRIKAADPSQIEGKDVTLSTGILNGGSMNDVKSQIDALLEKHPHSIMVLGTPTNYRFGPYNDMLKGIVDQYEDDPGTQNRVNFAGEVTEYSRDGIHPDNVPAYLGVTTGSGTGPQVANFGQPPSAAIGGGTRAPDRDARGPITSLPPGTSQMTPVGAVRADVQGGPNGVLTYMAQNHAPGATIGDAWNNFQSMMAGYFAYKGDPMGGMHAQEWIFRLQHQGATENLMQAYNALRAGDKVGAAQLAMRAYSFFNDGATMGAQIGSDGQIWAQRYSEDTHQPIGQPFAITEQGLLGMTQQTSDPQVFNEMVDRERKTNEEIAHNSALEEHGRQALETQLQIAQAQAQSRANLVQYAQAQAWQRAQLRANTQDMINQRNIASRQKGISDAYMRQVNTDADALYGPNAPVAATDVNGQPYDDNGREAAQTLYKNLRAYNPNLGSLMAQDMVRSLVAGVKNPKSQYGFASSTPDQKTGEVWLGVVDRKGNDKHVYLPQSAVQSVIPGPAPGQAPPPQQQPQVRPAAQVTPNG